MTKLKNAIISRSNYSIKKKHTSNKNSTIYERDYMSTTNLGGWDSGIFPNEESNFKMVTSNNYEISPKKINSSDWFTVNGNQIWTQTNLKKTNSKEENSNSKLIINENYNSLRDFCYYGSAYELVKTTINEIIETFPGELYVTEDNFKIGNIILGEDKINNEDSVQEEPVVIYNPFDIDIFSPFVKSTIVSKGYNPLRYFCESRQYYTIYDRDGKLRNCDLLKWKVTLDDKMENPQCLTDGDYCGSVELFQELDYTEDIRDIVELGKKMIVYIYYVGGQFIYLTSNYWRGYHIRPDITRCNEFYKNVGSFGKFLLNETSTPVHTCNLSVIEERGNKYVEVTKRFTWPSIGGWNIMTSGGPFKSYVNSLLDVATEYDSIYTDNLWRMIVHESIKNMDNTYINAPKNETTEDIEIGFGNMRGMLLAIARQYDELKKYIDNIKNVNSITYNGTKNVSDYFLTDSNEIEGWEINDPTKYLAETYVNYLFEGDNRDYDLAKTKLMFYKSLKLNSKAILSRKGTRQSIDMILNLFGFTSYDFARKRYLQLPINQLECEKVYYKEEDLIEINGKTYDKETVEYHPNSGTYTANSGSIVAVVGQENKRKKGRPLQWDEMDLKTRSKYFDYKLDEFVAVAKNTKKDLVDANIESDFERFYEMRSELEAPNYLPAKQVTVTKIDDFGNEVSKKYLIPWFEKDQIPGMYFQMYGGWNKLDAKLLSNDRIIKTDSNITIYDESTTYIKVIETIDKLLLLNRSNLKNGDIYYVANIENITDKISSLNTETASNYFYLNDVNYSNKLNDNGWVNVTNDELETLEKKDKRSNKTTPSIPAMKVLYLSSLIKDNSGNNPHIGHGKYDNGNEFLEYFRQIFKYYIDNGLFNDDAYDCETGKINKNISKYGFKIDGLSEDNVKVWFFSDNNQETKDILYPLPTGGYYNSGKSKTPDVGYNAYMNGDTTFETKLNAFNFETQKSGDNDEASANSVINVKNLRLSFVNNVDDIYQYRHYLSETVLPYVKQVIPSTTILETNIGEFTAQGYDTICFVYPQLVGYSKSGIAGLIKDEINEGAKFSTVFSSEFSNKDRITTT